MNAFPDLLLKGISDQQYLDEEGGVAANLFYFELQRVYSERNDEFVEGSICWKDNEEAVDLLMNQKKNGDIQFKYGAAVINRYEIDRLRKIPQYRSKLNYERNPLPENPYHGNLLLNRTTGKQVMRKLAGAIATTCQEIIPQPKLKDNK